MAKRRFLTLAALCSFILVLFILEPIIISEPWYPWYENADSYIAMGIIAIVDFLLLGLALWLGNTNEKLTLLLPASSVLSFIAGLIIGSVVKYGFFMTVDYVTLGLTAVISVVGFFVVKKDARGKSFFSIIVLSVMGLFGATIFNWVFPMFMAIHPGFFLCIVLLACLFNLLPQKGWFISHLTLVAALSIVALIPVFVNVADSVSPFLYTVFFMELIVFLLGAAYFVVMLVPPCKKLRIALDGKEVFCSEKELPQPPPATAKAAVQVDPLDALEELQKLREAGVLTEEEFAAQKNKILGGM